VGKQRNGQQILGLYRSGAMIRQEAFPANSYPLLPENPALMTRSIQRLPKGTPKWAEKLAG
jgi:hypothetical protein